MSGGSHPGSHAGYDTLVNTYAVAGNYQGERSVTTINGSGNPYDGDNNNYLSIFNGKLNVSADDVYTFTVDGDDAVELLIDINKDGDFDDTGEVVVGWYGGHGSCGCYDHTGTVNLTAGSYDFQFRHEEMTGGDGYYLHWQRSLPSNSMTDYVVRVKVAETSMPERNCKRYPSGNFKPVGLLQTHGETDSMYFGLITGSYTKNTNGGVLRKNISSISDEIATTTNGCFTAVNGIIQSINRLRITEYQYGDYNYKPGWEDAWVTTRPMKDGEFPDWGNPVGEMMFEAMRYFGDEGSPSSAFHSSSMSKDTALGLADASWAKPFDNYPHCSKPFILTISDIYPTYDSDSLPGSYFSGSPPQTVGAGGPLDVSAIADTIYAAEHSTGDRFIGQQAGTADSACTAKPVDGFGDVRGLCPEEPTKQGSYYSAAVAHYGRTNDISSVTGDQKVSTYAVGLASPLPSIEIPIKGKIIRLIPFAKSVGGCLGTNPTKGGFQPTNTIVDFYVERIEPHLGRFRINFEDVEQAADHDMDAIAFYEYRLIDAWDAPVTEATIDQAVAVEVTLTSEYAAGCITQHMGYIISGTTRDGTYLEIVDMDMDNGSPPSDVDYFLDTPDGVWADTGGTAWDDNQPLPFSHTRRFTVDSSGGATAASLMQNPLWYAAKWGGFVDQNGNGTPDLDQEWDKDADGVPDTYFYVVNPLKLEEQLSKSFADILSKTSSGTAAAVVANNSEGQGTMIQAFFKPEYMSTGGERVKWMGFLKSLWVDQFGHLREDSNHDAKLNYASDKIVKYGTDGNGNPYVRRYTEHYHYDPGNQFDSACVVTNCATSYETIGIDEIDPIFSAGEALYSRAAADRVIFTFLDGDGKDNDSDGNIDQSGEAEGAKIVGQAYALSDGHNDDNDELIRFSTDNADRIKPFLGLRDDAAFSYLETGGPNHDTRVQNLINYVRGLDSADLTGQPNTRNRTFNGDVWKLGDIVHSTPVSVAGAIDSYDLVYNDESYLTYLRKVAHRESVVYAGANDGMLHAFTHGQYAYDSINNEYGYQPVDGTPIGEELWAYIPQTLLPHLKWLADPDYGHTFYMDLKPKVFDARIFTPDADHPGGWGTLLLVGLGAGGKGIWAEGDFDDNAATPDVIRRFYSSYICMDVTDPRNPRLLWERSYDNLGLSTSYPAVLQVGAVYNSTSSEWSGGTWYAVFGSGPNDAIGKSDYSGYSDQNGYVFIVDVLTGNLLRRFDTGSANTVMSSPTTLDKGSDTNTGPVKGLTYNVDAIYIGAANYTGTEWQGKLFKINTRSGSVPDKDTSNWSMSTLFNSERPLTAPTALSVDQLDNVWVLFGTGRFQEMSDRVTTEQNYIIGIKDPYFNRQYDASGSSYNGQGDYYHNNAMARTVALSDLFYANPYETYATLGTIVSKSGGLSRIVGWQSLLEAVRNTEDQTVFADYFDGWYRELDARITVGLPSERVISKPAILGGVLFVPVYIPDDDICGFGGSTDIYGLYYETGTPMWQHIFRKPGTKVEDPVAYRAGAILNTGPPPPMVSVHIGRQSGAKLFMQTGAGPVLEAEVAIPEISSDIKYWNEP
jgi:type IV pilus assembly protein PilY1